ncbi:hypothetical protein EfmAA94_27150 [Enterococcus faecium]|nr:hypothetical protein EfmAA94_27150 [Enterococcus faecium]
MIGFTEPKNLFKSITFDCGKEFSNWKQISNVNDIAIYFADPGTPSQRGLNENSNGLLRREMSVVVHQTHWYMRGPGFLTLHPMMDELKITGLSNTFGSIFELRKY